MSMLNSINGGYSPANAGKAYGKEKTEKVEDSGKKAASAAEEKKAEKASAPRTDKFERTDSSVKNNTYTKGVATEHVGKSALNIKNEGMKDMVSQLLGQAVNSSDKKEGLTLESIMKSYGLDYIESDGSEDFWGAEKTAGRILDFAKSLAGSDPDKFAQVKSAFEKGFGQCAGIWGGDLPDICNQTADLVRQGFDDWEKEFSTQSDAAAQAAAQ